MAIFAATTISVAVTFGFALGMLGSALRATTGTVEFVPAAVLIGCSLGACIITLRSEQLPRWWWTAGPAPGAALTGLAFGIGGFIVAGRAQYPFLLAACVAAADARIAALGTGIAASVLVTGIVGLATSATQPRNEAAGSIAMGGQARSSITLFWRMASGKYWRGSR